jgi:type VI secretion system protein ImpL
VIIDTAGRYTTQDSDQSIDQAGWRNFLGLLKQTRPSQPLNGVLVVFDVAYLVGRSQDERRADARAVRTRLIELQEAFGLRLPVYVAFTKLDRIAGFAEFFDDLSKEEREQVLGITFPYAEKGPPPHKGFTDAFDRLLTRLRARLLDRLQAERDLPRRNLMFGFPAQFASLRPIVDEMLTEAADESRFATPLLVRGVYFTSATQQGLPIDRLMGVLSQKFGVSQVQMPAQVGAGRGFFLQRLFESVIYGEAGLVGANGAVMRRRRLIRMACFTATAVITLGLAGLWIWSYLDNRALVDRVTNRIDGLGPTLAYAQIQPLGDGDTQSVLELLNNLRDVETGYADQQAGRTRAWGFGLYQGGWLGTETAALYTRALQALLLPRLIARAQRRLLDGLDDPNQTLENLRTYLMLYDTRQLVPGKIRDWFARDWAGLPEDQRSALAGHLDALLATKNDWPGYGSDGKLPGINDALVLEARSRIQQLTPAQRALAALRGARIQDWSLTTLRDPTGAAIDNVTGVLRRQSGRPLSDFNPGFFTVRCYYNLVLPRLPEVVASNSGDAWIFGQTASLAGQLDLQNQLQAQTLDLYLQAYIDNWRGIIADLGFPPATDLQTTVQMLLQIGGSTSPYVRVMQWLARQVQLSTPLPQATPGTPAVADWALQAAAASGAYSTADECSSSTTVTSQISFRLGALAAAADALRATLTQRTSQGPNNVTLRVDEAFRYLIDFAGNNAERLNAFRSSVNTIAQQGNVYISQGGGLTELRQLLTRLQNETRAYIGQDSPLWPAMDRFTRGINPIIIQELRTNLTRNWAENVMPMCLRATQNKYPFYATANSANDSPLDDFARVFAPRTGLIDQFFNDNLRQYVNVTDPAHYVLSPQGQDLALSQDTLNQFSRAAQIRDAFFPPQGGGALGFIFDVTTQQPGNAQHTLIEIDSASMTIDQPQPPAPGAPPPPPSAPASLPNTTVQWNGHGGARIVLDDREVQKIEGPWAFLRFWQINPTRPVNNNGDQFTVTPRNTDLRLLLRARSRSNPFSAWQALNQFRCTPIQ